MQTQREKRCVWSEGVRSGSVVWQLSEHVRYILMESQLQTVEGDSVSRPD